jgi:transcriptional regulator with XRE-family HTH domain
MKGRLDVAALFSALDAARLARNLTWRAVADEAKVGASTLTRLSQGKRPDVDGTLALTRWLGMTVEDFERTQDGDAVRQPEPMAELLALLRADKNLTAEGRDMLDRLIRSAYREFRQR